MKTLLIGIKNVLLWSYARGTWQYDVLCILIIAAVFLVPSSFFGDRDRDRSMQIWRASKARTQANETLKVASKETEMIQWDVGVEELRAFLPELTQDEEWMNHPREVIVQYLKDHLNRPVALESWDPQRDEEQQIIVYRVRFK